MKSKKPGILPYKSCIDISTFSEDEESISKLVLANMVFGIKKIFLS